MRWPPAVVTGLDFLSPLCTYCGYQLFPNVGNVGEGGGRSVRKASEDCEVRSMIKGGGVVCC